MFLTCIFLLYLINITLEIISTDSKWQENFVSHTNDMGLKAGENLVSDTLMLKKKKKSGTNKSWT